MKLQVPIVLEQVPALGTYREDFQMEWILIKFCLQIETRFPIFLEIEERWQLNFWNMSALISMW